MRLLRIVALSLAGIAVLIVTAGFCWLYFYSRDLPDVTVLAQYAPMSATRVSDPCLGSSTAIPYEEIGANIRSAISAVETREDDPGVLRTTLEGFAGSESRPNRTIVASWYISRSLFCTPSKMLNRHLAEIRTAIQLERHYSRRRLLTMFANRVPVGPAVIGVHDGAEFYFRKKPADLNVAEAALLVGLSRRPFWLSPSTHPERALNRRNEVIDVMMERGSITGVDAQAAKAAPLGIVIGRSTSCCR